MDYIAIAAAPGIAICLYIFYRDMYNKEPRLNLVLSFIIGGIATVPAISIEQLLIRGLLDGSLRSVAILSFLVVGLTEEICKFIGLRLYAYNKKSFDEPFDGIVYSLMVGMGFATIENIMYVIKYESIMGNGLQIGLQRMFLSVPAHASFAIVMGYFIGKAKFDQRNSFKLMCLGILWATFIHGSYDFFLFINAFAEEGRNIGGLGRTLSEFFLLAGAVIALIVALILSRRLIKIHRQTSYIMFTEKKHVSVHRIEKATLNDIPLIRQLCFQVWPQTYAGILSQGQINYMLDMMYSEPSLQKQMAEGADFIIVYDGDIPVGFASFQEIEPTVYKLHKIYVLPSQQGKGTGRFAIDYVLNEIKQKGASALQLQVNRNNNAKGFYEKLGFNTIEEIKLDIGGGFVMDDYVMEKKIS